MPEPVRAITVWLADYPFTTYDGQPFLSPMRQRAEQFGRAHPGYRVEVTGHDFWTMADRVREAAERGTPPDIAGYYTSDSRLARDARTADGRPLFTCLERAFGDPRAFDDLLPAARACYTYGGELWALPLTVTTTVLYSNMTLLRAAGVDRPPRTWAEVDTACRALAARAGAPYGITWANHGWLFQQAVAQQGGLLADNDNGRTGQARRVRLTGTEMMAFVSWWRRLYANRHYLYTGEPGDWAGTFAAFAEQRVAMTIDSSKSAEELVGTGRDNGFPVAVSRMPYRDTVAYAGNLVAGDALWLADGLDDTVRSGALAFLRYLLEPAGLAEWHRRTGVAPATRTAVETLDRDGWFDDRPYQRVAVEQLAASDRSPAALGALLGEFEPIQDLLTRAMEDVLLRGADPATAFGRAQERAQRLHDAYLSTLTDSRPGNLREATRRAG